MRAPAITPKHIAACANLGRCAEHITGCCRYLDAAAAKSDKLWLGLITDEQRIAYGDRSEFVTIPQFLQKAHIALGQHDRALEHAERSRSRAFELLLAQQRVCTAEGRQQRAPPPGHAAPPGVDTAIISRLAIRQRVAIVIFSQLDPKHVLAWVVASSDGAISLVELHVPDGIKSLTQMVELTRRSLRVRARHAGPRRARSTASADSGSEHSWVMEPTIDEAALCATAAAEAAVHSDAAQPTLAEVRCALRLVGVEVDEGGGAAAPPACEASHVMVRIGQNDSPLVRQCVADPAVSNATQPLSTAYVRMARLMVGDANVIEGSESSSMADERPIASCSLCYQEGLNWGLHVDFYHCATCQYSLCKSCAALVSRRTHAASHTPTPTNAPTGSPSTEADALQAALMDRMLRRCHEVLVAPLSALLEDEPHLLIVPDRDLCAALLICAPRPFVCHRRHHAARD